MNCDDIRDRFSDLMDGDLPEADSRSLEAHLATCASCAREWSAFRRAVDAVRGLPQRSAPAGFADSIRENLERERLLASPRPTAILPLWRRPAFLGKALAAAAVLLIAVRIGTSPSSPLRHGRKTLALEQDRQQAFLTNTKPDVPVPAPAPPVAEPMGKKLMESCDREEDANDISAGPCTGSKDDGYAWKEGNARRDGKAGAGPDDVGGEPVLLAWVMPARDPDAAAERIRGILVDASRRTGEAEALLKAPEASRRPERASAELAVETGMEKVMKEKKEEDKDSFREEQHDPRKVLETGKAVKAVRDANFESARERRADKAPQAESASSPVRVLSFRVRAADLPAVRSRLAALGARPALSPEPPRAAARGAADAVALSPAPAAPPALAGEAKPDGEAWVILTVLLEEAP